PMSKLLVSTIRKTEMAPSSAPMHTVPTPSHTGLPVIVDKPTPASASSRPISAAKSSNSTTGSSGVLAPRTNSPQLAEPFSPRHAENRGRAGDQEADQLGQGDSQVGQQGGDDRLGPSLSCHTSPSSGHADRGPEDLGRLVHRPHGERRVGSGDPHRLATPQGHP